MEYEVKCVGKDGDKFTVKTADAEYESRAIIIASGRRPRTLNVPGEREYRNRGVTYCATCDGPLFAGKDVAIVGGGNSALDAAMQMLPIAGKIYLIDNADHIIGDPVVLEKVKASPKVEILRKTEVREIFGERFVNGMRVYSKESMEERTIPVEGVFVEIGSLPAWNPECNIKLNEKGEVVVNERCETNVEGVFSAGDVTSVPEKQIIVAAGQGCIACLSAFKYLSKKRFRGG